jgi:tripartite-type tricarboxylate transporter receptor subunit TctC
MKRRHVLSSAAAFTITAGLAPAIARADSFPEKPIRFVVPYAPGGATDTSARIAAEYLTNKLGQQVLVDNKPGGGTIIGTEIVAKAKPDGYTILLAPAPVATNTSFGLKLPYDPVKELAPVCSYVDMPLLLACNPKAPYTTMAEFLTWAKAQTSPIPYASAGNASMPHLWGEQLKMATGIKLDHVGYKGSADALKDVLGGHVMLFSDTLLPSGLAVKDGRLRGLVVAAAKRVPMLPDVPTVAEAGLPADLTGAVFFGVMATGGTPEPVIAKLNAAFNGLLADPATSKKLVDLGFVLVGGSAADYGKRIAAETAKWRKVIQEAKITPPA